MASGLHFYTGIALTPTSAFTGADVDTSSSGLRLASNRYIIIYKVTAPDISDGPDWQRLMWLHSNDGGMTWLLAKFNGLSWSDITAFMNLAGAAPATLPVNAINPDTGSIGQLITIVSTVDGPRAAFTSFPAPYVVGLNGTVVFSNGSSGGFRFIQAEDIKSDNAGINIYPLMSDGASGSAYNPLPPAAITVPSGPFKMLIARGGNPYQSSTVGIIELDSDTDRSGTHAPQYYVLMSNGDGTTTWTRLATIKPQYYETISAFVSLNSISAITAGDFNTAIADTISFTLQKPATVNVYIECTNPELGYTLNDRIPISTVTNSTGTRNGEYRLKYTVNTCTVFVTLYGMFLQDLTSPSGTATPSALTPSSWRLVVTTMKV